MLFIFWAMVTAIFAAGLLSANSAGGGIAVGQNSGVAGQVDGVVPAQSLDASGTALVLNAVELAKHNSSSSCWLLISGKMYDVTTFLNQHPGNAGTMLPYCGKDATTAYANKGTAGGSPHSSTASAMLAGYYIGTLNQSIAVSSGKTTASTETNSTVQVAPSPAPVIQTPVVPAPVAPSPTAPRPAPSSTVKLTSVELAKHNSRQSCWLLISGKIYDVTNFLNQHPGNASTILPTCGTDATQAYATRGGTGSHSSSATAMLDAYYIGDLDQTVATSATNLASLPMPAPTSVPRSGDDDDEDD